MQHGCRCLGAVLTHEDGWRIAFSGDTRPSSAFGAAGAGVDLLIHEATFDDSAEGRAFAEMKLHSTTGEALQIAEQYVLYSTIDVRDACDAHGYLRMRARVTLLTHFSCRYPRLSPRAVSTAPGALVLAQDGLRFRLGDAWKLQAYEHVVRAVASKGDEDDEVSAHMMTW
jgi:ribonuclease Z